MASSLEDPTEQQSQLHQPHQETEETLETEGTPVEAGDGALRGEADDPAVLLRIHFDTMDTTSLAKFLGDVSPPRTFEDLHTKYFKKMFDDDFRYPSRASYLCWRHSCRS